jgi:hypothetical protein
MVHFPQVISVSFLSNIPKSIQISHFLRVFFFPTGEKFLCILLEIKYFNKA